MKTTRQELNRVFNKLMSTGWDLSHRTSQGDTVFMYRGARLKVNVNNETMRNLQAAVVEG